MAIRDRDTVTKMRLWFIYKTFIKNSIIGEIAPDVQSIYYWRDNLFANIITYFLPSCFIALVPGVIISFVTGHQLIGIIDLAAFILILTITLKSSFSLIARKLLFIAILYLLSIFLIISLSLLGPGMIYLLTVSALSSIILPKIWGFITVVGNLLLCSCCALIIEFKLFDSPLQLYTMGTWIAVSSNLVFLSFVIVIVINHAIEKLETTLIADALLKEENKQVIKNLANSEQRLLQAQALAHLGSWELSFSSGVAVWSDEACRIYGLDTDDNKQSYESWLSFNHPDDIEEIAKATGEARKTFSDAGFFHRIVRKDNTIKYLYSQARYQLDERGVPVGMYGVAHDVTELKKNQEDLRKSNERFELINRATREAILDWDIINDVTYWGNGFTEIFGYPSSEFHNHLLSGNIHPEDRDEALSTLKMTLADPERNMLYREFRFLKSDRTVAYVQIRTVLIRNAGGKAIRAISSIMDVTDLVEKRKAIEKQNIALKEIAWIQSHMIRAPLANIMGLVDLLKHKKPDDPDEADLIEKIQNAADDMDRIIREIVNKTVIVEETLNIR